LFQAITIPSQTLNLSFSLAGGDGNNLPNPINLHSKRVSNKTLIHP